MVFNLVVKIAIYNFDLFHTALFDKGKPCVYSRRTKHTPQQWWSNGGCRTKSHRQQDHTMTLGPHLGKIPNNPHHTFFGEIAKNTHSHTHIGDLSLQANLDPVVQCVRQQQIGIANT